ncbi:MAG: bis(5'-nucleosyl)-tetraphosphatase (symmetrical) YqeK [Mogibacterium sp.]|nr:bis(5'-nucleosyl)-tetraphosphatase (symmetrical) YqeK [Mogibacterium sp.]
MVCIDREALDFFMKDSLDENRYRHSLGVSQMAAHLAEIYGADVEKAEFAGRYHDIAKCFDREHMNEMIRKYGLPDEYIDNPALAHSKVAAEILKNDFGVSDEDVLNSIRSHTTARVDMSLLEEIVYVADAIEDNRNYPQLKALQKQAETDLDGVCLIIMDFTIGKIYEAGRIPDRTTLEAREWIKERIGRKEN